MLAPPQRGSRQPTSPLAETKNDSEDGVALAAGRIAAHDMSNSSSQGSAFGRSLRQPVISGGVADQRWFTFEIRRIATLAIVAILVTVFSAAIPSDSYDGVVWASTWIGRVVPTLLLAVFLKNKWWPVVLAIMCTIIVVSVQMIPLYAVRHEDDTGIDCDAPGCLELAGGVVPWVSLAATMLGPLTILAGGGSVHPTITATFLMGLLFTLLTAPELSETGSIVAVAGVLVAMLVLVVLLICSAHSPSHARLKMNKSPNTNARRLVDSLDTPPTTRNVFLRIDPHGTIKSAAGGVWDLYHCHVSDMVGKQHTALVHGDDQMRVERTFAKQRASPDSTFTACYRRTVRSGSHPVLVEFHGFAVSSNGSPAGFVGWEVDASRVQSTTPVVGDDGDGATAAQRAISDKLISLTTNEIQNKLHAMTVYGSYLGEAEDVSADTKQDIQEIVQAAESTRALVEDILTLAMLRDGTVITTPEVTVVKYAMKAVLLRMSSLTTASITVYVAPLTPTSICIDMLHTSKILRKLFLYCADNPIRSDDPIVVQVSALPNQKLSIEVFDKGQSLDGTTVGTLPDVSARAASHNARVQSLAMLYPVVSQLASLMLGSFTFSESGGIVSSTLVLPYTLPSVVEAETAEKEVESADLSGIIDGIAPPEYRPTGPLPTLARTAPQAGAGGSSRTVSSSSRRVRTESTSSTPAAAGAAPKRTPIGFEGRLLNLHVMLVDDMKVIRRQGEMYLQQLGCTSVTLEDGDQIPQTLADAAQPFDSIVLDIMMGRTDGADVCEHLRKDLQVKCPIIAMTSRTSPAETQRYYKMGFDVVLSKPFNMAALARALIEGQSRRGDARITRMDAHLGDQRITTETTPFRPSLHAPGHVSYTSP